MWTSKLSELLSPQVREKMAATFLKARSVIVSALLGIALLGILGVKISWPQAFGQATGQMTPTPIQPWTTRTTPAVPAEIDTAKLNQAFTSLAETMSPTVVNIYSKTGLGGSSRRWRGPQPFQGPQDDFDFFFENPFGSRPGLPREAQALGSGFIVNTDGLIVTNAHVVRMAGRDADEIMVKLIGEDANRGHLAKVVGVDEATDVALLKLVEKVPGLKAAPLGDSDKLKVGEWVVAIGNPYGHAHTLTQGIVSALGRSIEGTRNEFIQTSASINPGNSGGPLINLAGEVIAINTAIDPRAQGIGFAIPINSAKTVLTQLMTNGHVNRAWLGLSIQDLNEDIAGAMKLDSQGGVLVRGVVPKEPAAKAGLEPYDVIRKINGKEVRSAKELVRMIDKLTIGQTAELEIMRGRDVKSVKVRVGEAPRASS